MREHAVFTHGKGKQAVDGLFPDLKQLPHRVCMAGASSTQLTLNIPMGTAPGTTGFTVTGTSGSLAHNASASAVTADSAPSAISVTPSSGSGSQQTFSFLSSDANGGTDIAGLQLLFDNAGGYVYACDFYIDRGSSGIWLRNDASTNWDSPVIAGQAGTLQNSQCILDSAGSSITPSGIYLTANLAITFKPAFVGSRNISMELWDVGSLHTGPVGRGTWTVTSGTGGADFTIDGSPSSQTTYHGGSIAYTVTATGSNGFNGAVNFSVSGLPAGATWTFSPTSVTGSGATTLTITTPSAVQPGTSTVTVTGLSGSLAHSVALTMTVSASTSDLDAFTACVGPASGTTACTLPTGTYRVSQSIPILHYPIAIQGGGTDPSQTLLVRDQYFIGEMMVLGSQNGAPNTVPLTGIKIQYLTFCSGSTVKQGDPIYPTGQNACPTTAQQNKTDCEKYSYPCLDLSITNTGPGQSWASSPGAPFNNTGPYNVEVSHSNFEDSSSNHPIFISPGNISPTVRQMVNDVYFHDNVISAGGVTIGANNGVNWDDYTQCDNWKAGRNTNTEFEDDNGAMWFVTPRDIRFSNNTFYPRDSGISGQGRYTGIYNNTIIDTVGGAGGGGAIEQEVCSSQVRIVGNTLMGGGPGISGMELYARNLTVSGNTASGFTFEGIGLLSTYNATATGNHLYNNDLVSHTGNYVNGNIKARTVWQDQKCTPAYACSSNPTIPPIVQITCDAWRDTQGLTIQNNDSQPAAPGVGIVQAGVFLPDHEGSSSYVSLASISGNNFNVGDVPAVDPNHNAHNLTNQHPSGQVVYHPRLAVSSEGMHSRSASICDIVTP